MSAALANQLPRPSVGVSRQPGLTSVDNTPRRARRPKLFYAFIAMVIVLGTIVAQIALSVMASSNAYEIDDLQTANKSMSRNYDQVNNDVSKLASPQNVARAAEKLGMVVSANPAYLRLKDGLIVGNTARAAANRALLRGVNANLVPNSQLPGMANPPVNSLTSSVAVSQSGGGSIALAQPSSRTIPAPRTR